MPVSKKMLWGAIIALLIYALIGPLNLFELRWEEPRRALIALEMMLQGDYINPTINGVPYYSKPPLFNWVLAGFMKITGSSSELVLRLPGILAFLLTGAGVYLWVKRYLDQKTAVLAAFFFLTGADLLFYGTFNSGEIDLFYSFIVFLQVAGLFYFHQRKQWAAMFLWSYLFAALGFLTKGIPSLLFLGITLVAWLVWNRQWKLLFHPMNFVGAGLFGLITGTYYYIFHASGGDLYTAFAFMFKDASRKSINETPFWQLPLQLLQFPAMLIFWMLPWSLLAVLWVRNDYIKRIKEHPVLLFSAIFILANIIIYWISPKVANRYVYMFFPFFSVLLAYGFTSIATVPRWLNNIGRYGGAGLMFSGGVGWLVFSKLYGNNLLFGIVFGLASVRLAVMYFRSTDYRALLFICFVVVQRIAFNWLVMPYVAATADYLVFKEQATEIVEITGDEPVHYAGPNWGETFPVTIGPIALDTVHKPGPPFLRFQIPLYISSMNRHVMQYDEHPTSGTYYLVGKPFYKHDPALIEYEFTDVWNKGEFVLYRQP